MIENLDFHARWRDRPYEILKGLTDLGRLHLEATQITDAGLVHLTVLTKLRELDLMSTQITDTGLEHLTGLTNLNSLFLRGTQVTDDGIKKLQQALPKCKIRH